MTDNTCTRTKEYFDFKKLRNIFIFQLMNNYMEIVSLSSHTGKFKYFQQLMIFIVPNPNKCVTGCLDSKRGVQFLSTGPNF